MGLEGFDGVFFDGFCFGESLAIVEVDQISGSVILAPLPTFRTVSGEVSHFSALETGIGRVCRGGCIALEVVLWLVSLVAVRVLSSAEVIASIVPSVVSSRWCPIPIYVHGNGGIIHPARGV